MGCGSSTRMACFYKRPDIEPQWYGPDSDESLAWQDAEDDFGQARNKSFRTGATLHSSLNRKGNENGELGGRVVFFNKANDQTDYSRRELDPSFTLHADSKIFAKAFFSVPTGMMPIGENNLLYKKQSSKPGATNYFGFGPALLAPIVRATALFVHVDGVPQTNEIFCSKSADADDNMRTKQDVNENEEESDPVVTSAIPGSFVTFCPSRIQDKFFFLHLPILCPHEDCASIETGSYSLTTAEAFFKLFCTLSPGKHNIRVTVQIYYDFSEFRYHVLDRNMNARGQWYDKLPNDALKCPYPEPTPLRSPDAPIAEGLFTLDMPFQFSKMFDGMLDHKPPRERYTDDDLDEVRKDAGVVAMGQFTKLFETVQGLPDITVLTSKQRDVSEKDNKSGTQFTYKVIEFVACWLDPNDTSPQGLGTMYAGAMVKGQISPREFTGTWGWHSLRKNDEIVKPVPIQIKNKYILSSMVKRRRSQIEQLDLPKRLIELSKDMGKSDKKNS